jgi:Exostosin family
MTMMMWGIVLSLVSLPMSTILLHSNDYDGEQFAQFIPNVTFQDWMTLDPRMIWFDERNNSTSPVSVGPTLVTEAATRVAGAATTMTVTSGAASASKVHVVIQDVVHRLTTLSLHLRYYVLEDPQFDLISMTSTTNRPLRDRYGSFADAEEYMIRTLRAVTTTTTTAPNNNHNNSSSHHPPPPPLRTSDPEQADLFFIPVSLTRHLISRSKAVNAVFDAIYNATTFQSHEGNRHFMIVQTQNMWSNRHLGAYRKNKLRLSEHYPKLWNVTMGKVFDQEGCAAAAENGLLEGNDFKDRMLDGAIPMSRSTFSMNLIPLPTFPFVPASLEKFQTASWDCFYHSRQEPSLNNSTHYRHALLNETRIQALPRCSLGFDIPPNLWLQRFQSSRFCLVIRGDDPMSRSLLRAVKVGCIPVIISDLFEYYAPTFKRSIAVSAYSILIPEYEFRTDPVAAVLKLNTVSDDVIVEKLKYLALAQRLLLPDHPQSLFVPALLYEAWEAMKRASNRTQWPLKRLSRFIS